MTPQARIVVRNPPPHLAARAGWAWRAPPRAPPPCARGGPSPQPLTFIDGPWAGPALPNPSLLSTGPRPAWPGPTPHFYWPAQTPHFYWLALAKFARAGGVKLRPRRARRGWARSADQPPFDLAPPARTRAPPPPARMASLLGDVSASHRSRAKADFPKPTSLARCEHLMWHITSHHITSHHHYK